MRRALTVAVAMLVGALVAVPHASAQEEGFTEGYMDIGPTIGLGNIGSASIAFGGRFEVAVKPMPDLGNGMIGVMIGADFYSWSDRDFSLKYIPVGATANYHFRVENNQKIDPFLGLGLGYQIISCSYDGLGDDFCTNSALYFIGRAGGRYFVKPNMALYADVGAGAATLNVGATFKLK